MSGPLSNADPDLHKKTSLSLSRRPSSHGKNKSDETAQTEVEYIPH